MSSDREGNLGAAFLWLLLALVAGIIGYYADKSVKQEWMREVLKEQQQEQQTKTK